MFQIQKLPAIIDPMNEIRWRIFGEAVYRALNMIAAEKRNAFLDPTPTDALLAVAKIKEAIEEADVKVY